MKLLTLTSPRFLSLPLPLSSSCFWLLFTQHREPDCQMNPWDFLDAKDSLGKRREGVGRKKWLADKKKLFNKCRRKFDKRKEDYRTWFSARFCRFNWFRYAYFTGNDRASFFSPFLFFFFNTRLFRKTFTRNWIRRVYGIGWYLITYDEIARLI